MQHIPLTSIVIATYNRSRSITRSILSVLAQTDTDLEVVIVDDGSTDDTELVVRGIVDPRIRYIKLPTNGGASCARNRGIHEARGEWVFVWDSDDELYPHAVAAIRKTIDEHSECIVVSAPARMVSGGNPVVFPRHESGYISLEQVLCKYVGNDEKVRCVKREAYLKAPYVSCNIDFIVSARLRAQGSWFHINEYLGDVFLDNPDSLTRKRKQFDRSRSADRAPYLDAFMNDFGIMLKQSCPQRYGELAYGTSLACASAGTKEKARHYAFEAIKAQPLSWRSYGTLLFSIFLPRRRD